MNQKAETLREQSGFDGELVPIEQASVSCSVTSGEIVVFHAEVVSDSDAERSALATLTFYGDDAEVVENEAWPAKSDVVGDFLYLNPSTAESPIAHTRVEIRVPDGATRCDFQGVKWRQNVDTYILEGFKLEAPSSEDPFTELATGFPLPYKSSSFIQRFDLPIGCQNVLTTTRFISSSNAKGVAPLQVRFYDDEGRSLLGFTDLAQNPSFGAFIGLPAGKSDIYSYERLLQVPESAKILEIQGIEWGANSATIYGPIEVSFPESNEFSIVSFLEEIPKDTPLAVIDTTAPPLGHDTLALRPSNLTAAYAKQGWAVVFVPFGGTQDFPQRFAETVAQIPREGFDEMLNAVLADRSSTNSIYICSSFPSLQAIAAAQKFKSYGWKVVYECRDDMEEFRRVGYSKWYDPQLERQMLRLADLTVSVSRALDEKLVSLHPILKNHHVVPNGVNQHVIDGAAHLRSRDAVKARNSSRKIGYVGHLTDSWFDWPLLIEGANRLSNIQFEIVGHGMPEGLKLPANVEFLGPKNHDELPEIVRDWKGGLIPFKDLPLTRSVDPNKIYEYLAWGLRTVSAPMGMVGTYPSTWVYRGVDEFVSAVSQVINTDFADSEMDVFEKFLQTCSWDQRALQMNSLFRVNAGMGED